MIFPEFSLANLSSLGYTEDEARFLYLVSTHSGYFSMRQFLQFTGTKSGDKSMAFSQKLLGKGHATARSFLRNGLVYHLFSRIVYRAIDRENLRNRRAHSLEHIRTRDRKSTRLNSSHTVISYAVFCLKKKKKKKKKIIKKKQKIKTTPRYT